MAQQQSATPNAPFTVIEKRGPNLDAVDRVTGRAKYVGDIEVPGMLFAKVLRSPHPHARIVAIDTSKAEALPGVRAVVTYRDAPKVMNWGHRNYVLNDTMRFKGEPAAAVAAVDEDVALEALSLIAIKYEPLPFVLDPEEAMKPTAPKLFEDGNLEGEARILTRGNIEQGFAAADRVIERAYHCPTMWSGSLEPRVAIAQWDGTDRLTLWASTQAPYRVHNNLCQLFDLAESNVRVVASYVGSGFGTKSANHQEEGIVALLARKAGRPVKLQFTREEEILDSNSRFETKMYTRIGVKNDMTITAFEMKCITNLGAYHTRLGGLGNQSTHIYNIPNLRTEQYRVHTNVVNTGPTRGVGDPQECFGVESAIDEIANEMGWDPVAFRLKNIKRSGDPVARGGGGEEDGRLVTQVLDKCIEEGAAKFGWAQAVNKTPGAGGPIVRGVGVALTERGGGGGQGAARVVVYRDGSAKVFYASTDIGTGSKTTLSMIAAETLGMPLSAFQAVAGDTEAAPYEGGSYGNRVLQGTGRAVEAAARSARQQILNAARPMLENVPADQLEMVNGVIRLKAQPDKSVKLAQVMQRRNIIVGEGYTMQPQSAMDVERTSGAHFVEVEVNKETGKFKVLRVLAAHDLGRPINITIVENQIEGGTIQGLALALGEELRYDKRTGLPLATSIQELRHPTQLDFDPRTVEAMIVKNEGAVGPYGAKGLGENPTHPGMAAVANAIYNATGIRLREVPFTRSKVLQALSAAQSARPTA